ncbi:MAG: glycyl-radical enzyme activating protein [Lachnospiraceae bacterium]|nr:glycyl-radical enzyme activating protein [Lachnospiraceae bacterium]
METGIVFNIQKFSIHDGPGIRTNVFLKGCPLRCLWCHNPEGLEREPELEYEASKCIGCGACSVCPEGCHSFSEKKGHVFDRTHCIRCGKCAAVCPASALELTGEQYDVERVMEKVMADKLFYDKSGGGMTLSGGEPLFQPRFALALLKEAKNRGIHTVIETSGFASAEVFGSILPYTDLLLMDYKVTGEEAHVKATGVPFAPILANMELANAAGVPIVLRCPIIPGINDMEVHYEAIAELADRLTVVTKVELEAYHSLGTGKAPRLGKEAGFVTEPPSKEKMEEIRRYIQERCSKAVEIS